MYFFQVELTEVYVNLEATSDQRQRKLQYFGPWRRITDFAKLLCNKLQERFPKEAFLEALDIMEPHEWKTMRDFKSSIHMLFALFLLIAKNGN